MKKKSLSLSKSLLADVKLDSQESRFTSEEIKRPLQATNLFPEVAKLAPEVTKLVPEVAKPVPHSKGGFIASQNGSYKPGTLSPTKIEAFLRGNPIISLVIGFVVAIVTVQIIRFIVQVVKFIWGWISNK